MRGVRLEPRPRKETPSLPRVDDRRFATMESDPFPRYTRWLREFDLKRNGRRSTSSGGDELVVNESPAAGM